MKNHLIIPYGHIIYFNPEGGKTQSITLMFVRSLLVSLTRSSFICSIIHSFIHWFVRSLVQLFHRKVLNLLIHDS